MQRRRVTRESRRSNVFEPYPIFVCRVVTSPGRSPSAHPTPLSSRHAPSSSAALTHSPLFLSHRIAHPTCTPCRATHNSVATKLMTIYVIDRAYPGASFIGKAALVAELADRFPYSEGRIQVACGNRRFRTRTHGKRVPLNGHPYISTTSILATGSSKLRRATTPTHSRRDLEGSNPTLTSQTRTPPAPFPPRCTPTFSERLRRTAGAVMRESALDIAEKRFLLGGGTPECE